MNSVILTGRLTRDPEVKMVGTDNAVTKFTIAVDKQLSREKKQEFEQKGQPTADFINITVWGKGRSETLTKFLRKGLLILVEGRLEINSYKNDKGEWQNFTQVVAREVEFLEWGQTPQGNQESKQPDQTPTPGGFSSVDDANIPF